MSKTAPLLFLNRVELAGFKAVKESEAVQLGKFTLFIGRNGAGKSSFVESLQWIQESMFHGLQRATEERFADYDSLKNRRSTSTSILLEFQAGTAPLIYNLEVSQAAGKSGRPIVAAERLRIGRTFAQRALVQSRKGPTGPAVRSIKGGNPVRDGDTLALGASGSNRWLTSMQRFLSRMVVLRLAPYALTRESSLERRSRGSMLDESGLGLPALLHQLSPSRRDEVAKHLGRVIGGIEAIEARKTTSGRGDWRVKERMRARGGRQVFDIPALMLSEGTRRLAAVFALLAVRPSPSMLIIEEVENGLDPWTLEYVLQQLRDASARGVQIVLTTHSPFLLDHVQADEVIVVKREIGDSSFTRISDFTDVARYGGVVAPGAMYLAGYYDSPRRGGNG